MAGFHMAGSASEGIKSYWRVVIVLMLIYTYAFVDRMILALLVDPVRTTLGASDVQMSLLLGLAFAGVYCACNIPAGYLADRVDRRLMIGIASVFWALMTVLCGTATTFAHLFLARAGVGIAEGVISPTSFSMIRDAVPSRSRALAFSIYGMAPMIGNAMSLTGGAYLLDAAAKGAFAGTPVLGGLEPWQCTMVIVGLVGMPLALLLLSFREPPRLSDPAKAGESMGSAMLDACRYMILHRRIYLPLLIFSAFGAMMSFGKNAWLPAALSRHWGLPPAQIGMPLGIMTLIGGIVGLLFGGWIMNRSIERGGTALVYGIISVLGTAAGVVIAFTTPILSLAYVGVQVALFFVGVSYAAAATTLGDVTPVAMMGRVSAVYLVVQTLIGQSVGPLAVALVAKVFFRGPSDISIALCVTMIVLAVVCVMSAVSLIGSHRARRRDFALAV